MTFRFPSADSLSLHARYWQGEAPRGVLVIAHGLGEHSGCYAPLAESLSARSGLVDVLAFDFRGHGLSPGRRGVVRRYEELVDDLRSAVHWAGQHRPGQPVFLLGHSNGGQVALRLVSEGDHGVAGTILSNPTLALALSVPRWKLALGRFLDRFAPSVTLSAGLDPAQMTRDEATWRERAADPLRHNRVSAPLYFGMIAGGANLLARAAAITTPTLLIVGDEDPVVAAGAAAEFYDRLGSPSKALRRYPEMRHEPLNEVGREAVIDAVASWLTDRLDVAQPSFTAG
jgi:alpha-beta hydrolase superfamily lysophospholipase